MAIRLTNAAASAAAGSTGLGAYIGASAVIKFYVGNVNASVESNPAGTLLGTLTISGSFGSPTNGAIATSTIGSDTSADASGTPACFRLFKSDGTTAVLDGTVALTSGGDINFDNITWIAGGTIAMSTLTITIPPA